VHTDARGYVTAMARGDLQAGFEIADDPNPLSTICGRICGAPCETACRRSDIGPDEKAIAIRPIKRVLTEHHGPEAKTRPPGRQENITYISNGPGDELKVFSPDPHKAGSPQRSLPGTGPKDPYSRVRWSKAELVRLASTPGHTSGTVAVIGAGPSGLSAAHDLALLGHKVTIYEAGPKTGGMMRYGVPIYRIDQDDMDAEIQSILDLGVEIRFNTRIGDDLTLDDLRRHHDAVFLGVGLMKGRTLNIPGADLDGVISAVDLLLNYNLGYKVTLGEKVLVIGGGDVAMDAARTALRLGQASADADASHAEESSEAVTTALDVARTALRLGVSDVRMIALESMDELPASDFEVEEALEEGIHLFTRTGPKRILGKDGAVRAIEILAVESVFDEQGRFNPKFKPDSEEIWECDTVILAVGQQADLDLLGGADDIRLTPRGLVEIDPDSGQTTAPDVFAGGDVAYGPRLIIDAVKHGHVAALGIDEFIQGRKLQVEMQTEWTELPNHVMFENWTKLHRQKVPSRPVERRTGISVVDLGYSIEEAAAQGSRCLECSVNTIFDGSLCILCNACVDVCPWDCLKIVGLQDIEHTTEFQAAFESQFGLGIDAAANGSAVGIAAMLKDDEACTRCALCAERCPTGAITMEAFRFQEVLSYEE
jgi:NADPH-dependent glutamate synthase beta subunit-like oxidoreductase